MIVVHHFYFVVISSGNTLYVLGGPVTHLYESLTGNKWDVHGESKYCCYSIYQQTDGEDTWTPLVVNQVLGTEQGTSSAPAAATADGKTFTWA